MTVSSQVARADYVGNGSTVIFAVPFYFLADAHLRVYVYDSQTQVETRLILNDGGPNGYTVQGAGNPAGGSITTVTVYQAHHTITILRDPALLQELDYIELDTFPADSHERGLDLLTMISQMINEEVGRALRSSPTTPSDLQIPAYSAGRAWKWDLQEVKLINTLNDPDDAEAAARRAEEAADRAEQAAASIPDFNQPHQWTALQYYGDNTLTINAGVVDWNASTHPSALLNMTENITLNNPSAIFDGAVISVLVTSAGPYTITFGSVYEFGSLGIQQPIPGSATIYSFKYQGGKARLFGLFLGA